MLTDPLCNDHWLETETGKYVFSRQEKLILSLLSPSAGESLLDVRCGTGNYLQMFQKKKCLIAGLDESSVALNTARNKLGSSCELVQGNAADLPFSDNEFDMVTLINGLNTVADPEQVIAEAFRVCRNRVFIGFFNKHSLVGTRWSVSKLFGIFDTSNVRFFTLNEMKFLINETMAVSSVTWGSVIYLPRPVYIFFSELEEIFPLKKNPLGAFVGMVIPVRYTYRTVQNPAKNGFELNTKAQTAAADVVRGMLRGRD